MVIDPTGGWAKAVEKTGEATTEVARAGREAGHVVAPAFRQLVGMAEDQFAVWRAMLQVRLAAKYEGFMRERGLEAATREVAPAFLLPLIDRASLEDDDKLQDVWAMMLANAADADSGADMRTAFVAMLGEMTHLDVVILARLVAAFPEPDFKGVLPTSMLPERVGDDGQGRLPTAPVAVSLANLGRLGCIHPTTGLGGWFAYGRVTVTDLGKAFVAACTPPAQTRSW
jgi:hypothetical protein